MSKQIGERAKLRQDARFRMHTKYPADAQRRRWASAMRALPSAVRGPVESPPWKRQRTLPGSTRTAHGRPWRLRAPQRGRSLRLSGEPSPAKPIARMAKGIRRLRSQGVVLVIPITIEPNCLRHEQGRM